MLQKIACRRSLATGPRTFDGCSRAACKGADARTHTETQSPRGLKWQRSPAHRFSPVRQAPDGGKVAPKVKGVHMKIAVLGTGMVGATIGSKLVALGHEVRMGARAATNEKAAAWVAQAGERASHGTFADAAAFG